MQVGIGGSGSLVAAVTGAQAVVEGLLLAALPIASPRERLTALVQVEATSRTLEAVRLGLIRSLDCPAIGGEGLAELGATTLPRLLEAELGTGAGRARADVAAARATDPHAALDPVAAQDRGSLPGMGAALARGEVSRAHVDVAVRTVDKIPARIRRAAAPVVDDFLVEVSTAHPPRECENLAAEVLDRLDPDRTERGYDPDAHLRRRLDVVVDATGMVLVRGQLDPLNGAAFRTAIDHFSAPVPAGTDETGQVVAGDTRTPSQRRADALGAIAAAAMGSAGTRGGEPPRVVVHTTLDQLRALTSPAARDRGTAGRADCEQTGPITPAVLERLTCDAVLNRVLTAPNGAVLDLGRAVRLATSAQRRALAARDRGCVVPGCRRPPTWCDAHHVIPWHRGGPTDLGNLVLLCPAHHNAVHAGTVAVRVREGVAWVRLDDHLALAATTPWRTDNRHDDHRAAGRVAEQVRLAIELPRRPPEPHLRT